MIFVRIYRMMRRFAYHCLDDSITVYAAMASFFLVMSTVPFLMLLISLTRVVVPNEIEGLLAFVFEHMPPSISDFVNKIVQELFVVDTSQVISLTVILALWAASKGIMGLEQGMHVIYSAPLRGNYLIRRIRSTLYTLIFLVAIIIAILFLVLGESLTALFIQQLPFLIPFSQAILTLRITLSVIIFILVFTLGYKSLTGVPCTFMETLPGVVFSTAGWVVFSWMFSIYITNFSDYTYLYGSMGALILLLMWFYICMLILMIGAELNVLLWELRHHKYTF